MGIDPSNPFDKAALQHTSIKVKSRQAPVGKVVYSKPDLTGRKVSIGVLDPGVIDEAYWLYTQGRRLGLVEQNDLGVIVYRKITFRHKWLFMDSLREDDLQRDSLLLKISDGLRNG